MINKNDSFTTNHFCKFKNGQPQGQGTIIFAEGGRYVGEFREFKPWNAIEYDKEGNITGRCKNGEMK